MSYAKNNTLNKSLSSKLNNRIEIWGNLKVDSDLGMTIAESFIKKVWADIIPLSGTIQTGEANTELSSIKLKIRIRKTQLEEKNYIIYKEKRYEIEYIHQDFNNNKFLDVFTKLKTE
ncbi:MAG: phage head closure protein [Fusobacteriaceae bacterium]